MEKELFDAIVGVVEVLAKVGVPLDFVSVAELSHVYEVELLDKEVNAHIYKSANMPNTNAPNKNAMFSVYISKTYFTAPNCPELDRKFKIPENESLMYKAFARCGIIIRQDWKSWRRLKWPSI